MPDFGKRLVEGGVQGVSGISRALLQKYLMDFEREQQETESRQAEEQLGLQRMLTGARVTELGQRHLPEPEKAKTKTEVEAEKLAELFQDPDFARQYFLKGKTVRDPNITGIPSGEQILSGREDITGKAREEAGENIISRYYDLLRGEENLPLSLIKSRSPEELAQAVRGSVPATVEQDRPGLFTGSDIVANPELAAIDSILENIAIPREFQRPTGAGATAFADSAEAARTDPTIAAALMDFLPQPAGQTEQAGQAITLNPDEQDLLVKIRRNPALIDSTDWEEVQRENPDVDVQRVLGMVEQ